MTWVINVALAFIALWCAVPLGVLLAFTCWYGCRAECTVRLYYGLGVPLGVRLGHGELYYCPVGVVGVEVEMDRVRGPR